MKSTNFDSNLGIGNAGLSAFGPDGHCGQNHQNIVFTRVTGGGKIYMYATEYTGSYGFFCGARSNIDSRLVDP